MQLAVVPLTDLPRRARDLVTYCKEEKGEVETESKLLSMIELLVIANFPTLSNEEIQKMLKLSNIRETRFYKEAAKEGLEKGQAGIIAKLHEKGMNVREIAELLDLNQKTVRALLKLSAKK